MVGSLSEYNERTMLFFHFLQRRAHSARDAHDEIERIAL